MSADNEEPEAVLLKPTADDLDPPWFWLGFLVFIGVSAVALYTGPWSGGSSRHQWIETPVIWYPFWSLCLTFGALGFWAITHPRPYTLTLDAQGFELTGGDNKWRYRWLDIDGPFAAQKMGRKYVVFTPRNTPLWTKFMSQGRGALPHLYGYEAEDLAKLLNDWRERAIRLPCGANDPACG
jgi:hypothetical protein